MWTTEYESPKFRLNKGETAYAIFNKANKTIKIYKKADFVHEVHERSRTMEDFEQVLDSFWK